MKTAISLPDRTFEEAEKLAKRLGVSRSELFTKALESYLKLYRDEAMTEALDRFFDQHQQDPDSFVREAARKVFEADEW